MSNVTKQEMAEILDEIAEAIATNQSEGLRHMAWRLEQKEVMRIEDVLREMRAGLLPKKAWADTIEDEMTSIRRYAEMVLKGPGTGMPDNREWYLEGVRQLQKMARLDLKEGQRSNDRN